MQIGSGDKKYIIICPIHVQSITTYTHCTCASYMGCIIPIAYSVQNYMYMYLIQAVKKVPGYLFKLNLSKFLHALVAQ